MDPDRELTTLRRAFFAPSAAEVEDLPGNTGNRQAQDEVVELVRSALVGESRAGPDQPPHRQLDGHGQRQPSGVVDGVDLHHGRAIVMAKGELSVAGLDRFPVHPQRDRGELRGPVLPGPGSTEPRAADPPPPVLRQHSDVDGLVDHIAHHGIHTGAQQVANLRHVELADIGAPMSNGRQPAGRHIEDQRDSFGVEYEAGVDGFDHDLFRAFLVDVGAGSGQPQERRISRSIGNS